MNGDPTNTSNNMIPHPRLRDSVMMVDAETTNRNLNRNSDHFIRNLMEPSVRHSKLGDEMLSFECGEAMDGVVIGRAESHSLQVGLGHTANQAAEVPASEQPVFSFGGSAQVEPLREVREGEGLAAPTDESLARKQRLRKSDPFVAGGFELFGLDKPLELGPDVDGDSAMLQRPEMEANQLEVPSFSQDPLQLQPQPPAIQPILYPDFTQPPPSMMPVPQLGFQGPPLNQPPPGFFPTVEQQQQQQQQQQQLHLFHQQQQLEQMQQHQLQQIQLQQIHQQQQQQQFQFQAAALVASLTPEQRLTLAAEAISQQPIQPVLISAPVISPSSTLAFTPVLLTPTPAPVQMQPSLDFTSMQFQSDIHSIPSIPRQPASGKSSLSRPLIPQEPTLLAAITPEILNPIQQQFIQPPIEHVVAQPPQQSVAPLVTAPTSMEGNSGNDDEDSDAMIDDLYISAKTVVSAMTAEPQQQQQQTEQKLKKRISFLGGLNASASWFSRNNGTVEQQSGGDEEGMDNNRKKLSRRLSRPLSALFGGGASAQVKEEANSDGDDERGEDQNNVETSAMKEKSNVSTLKKRLSTIALSLGSGKSLFSKVIESPPSPSPLDQSILPTPVTTAECMDVQGNDSDDGDFSTTDVDSKFGSLGRKRPALDSEVSSISRASEIERGSVGGAAAMPYVCTHCQRPFLRKHDLKRHETTTHGGGTFKCETCPKTFTRNDALQRHIKGRCKGLRGIAKG
ncbi:hypothetical protein BCR33DRAFT_718464 [Rhizoclosmatium globosum]|uniref:C2H2-type domain-containing protein n=1 Tax=Rhizoclosmatium globosum TaxID=329046 RepID=A0A1Y2C5J6_9FUNG|nr:hypothetical protein BCR33DRAFT_718464 [Rhizoclosmatium globosum]|eukprot:ORY42301.1 hypothetical protein BCR33DRAFT_718464 [Rhizoclosmatium globosum]